MKASLISSPHQVHPLAYDLLIKAMNEALQLSVTKKT
jgi:hypothetical protein